MNNMLYIIVGLVVIVLVAVVVLRKKKIQQPPSQTAKRAGKNLATSGLATKTESASSNQKVKQNATQFDPLTVAQRFMDQQRYDKAIETLERGLMEKPQNANLLLKLLNIYAINNQYDDFNKTYNLVKSFDDTAAIGEADQLKALLEQEQIQNQPVESETNSESTFETLDFDLSTPPPATQTQPTSSADNLDELSAQSDIMGARQDGSDDSFALILEDLDTTESNANNDNEFDIAEEINFDEISAEPINSENPNAVKNINVDDDFTLDFDLMSDDNSSSELNVVNDVQVQDSQEQHISLDDDFVLALDDLVTETDSTDTLEESIQTDSNDFALLLKNEDSIAVEKSVNENASSLFDVDVEDTLAQIDALSVGEALSTNDATQPVLSEVSDTDTAMSTFNIERSDVEAFDNIIVDNKSSDDDLSINEFDFDTEITSPTATMPVKSQSAASLFEDNFESNADNDKVDNQNVATPTDTDFAAQFAKDFDFVNALDSSQVTLDLAGQYLQLGEYDSAKRLLNEVITQGNSEQQNKAQEILARTA